MDTPLPQLPEPLATPGFSLVVAMDRERGIGRDGDLAWRLPPDMKWFRKVTVGDGGQSVIMGRRTWDSIPDAFRPLPGRQNIVLSRSELAGLPEGAEPAVSLEHALQQAHGPRFVIGGGMIYAEALEHPLCRRIYLTEVLGSFACDTFLPRFDASWVKRSILGEGKHDEIGYRFVLLER